ncbi:hypothetical protein TWF706_008561 [Orbilia oligospora]|nr:hypothetical protein TWF706_008561 [Orbilia oligospora]KAF3298567.1 hypothetical protein TWF132_000369 [Orbilia oligospora]
MSHPTETDSADKHVDKHAADVHKPNRNSRFEKTLSTSLSRLMSKKDPHKRSSLIDKQAVSVSFVVDLGKKRTHVMDC